MLTFNAGIALLTVFRNLKELCCPKKEANENKESGLAKVLVKRRDNMTRLQKKYIKKASTGGNQDSSKESIINQLKKDAEKIKVKGL